MVSCCHRQKSSVLKWQSTKSKKKKVICLTVTVWVKDCWNLQVKQPLVSLDKYKKQITSITESSKEDYSPCAKLHRRLSRCKTPIKVMHKASVGRVVSPGSSLHRPLRSGKKQRDQKRKTKEEMRKHQARSQKYDKPSLAMGCHRPRRSTELWAQEPRPAAQFLLGWAKREFARSW